MKKTYCLVIVVGPGTGSVCVRCFMDGSYSASMISRNQRRLEEFAADMPFAKRRQSKERPDDFYAKPSELADEIYHIAHQSHSIRSFLVELRPFGES